MPFVSRACPQMSEREAGHDIYGEHDAHMMPRRARCRGDSRGKEKRKEGQAGDEARCHARVREYHDVVSILMSCAMMIDSA